jgi:hypothetical protein
MGKFETKIAVLIYLCGMVVVHAVVFWHARELIRKGYADFTIYYSAATMVRRGLGHELYNNIAQYKVQREFAPDVATRLDALPFNHPSFEALFFVPFTYLSYLPAFIVWALMNLGVLMVLPFLIRAYMPELQKYPWPLWLLVSLAFFPIFFTLLQGQDAIVLLLLYALALVFLKRNSEALAGGVLAIGLFKPHLIVPFVFLWVLRSGARILYGFLPGAAALALISTAIVGLPGLLSYPRYVLSLEKTMARGAILPSDMPNVRGVIYVLSHGRLQHATVAIAVSCAILLLAAWQLRIKEGAPDLFCWKFALAIVATVLVSYHCLGYDLTVLLLPILLIVSKLRHAGAVSAWPRALMLSGIGPLFFSPLQVFLLLRGNRLAVVGCAVLLLFSGIVAQIWFETGNGDSPPPSCVGLFGDKADCKSQLNSGTIVSN